MRHWDPGFHTGAARASIFQNKSISCSSVQRISMLELFPPPLSYLPFIPSTIFCHQKLNDLPPFGQSNRFANMAAMASLFKEICFHMVNIY